MYQVTSSYTQDKYVNNKKTNKHVRTPYKYKKKTKKTCFYITSIVLLGISLAFSITGLCGVVFSRRSFDSAVCGAMRFTYEAIHGAVNEDDYPKWIGLLNIESFNEEFITQLNSARGEMVVRLNTENINDENGNYTDKIRNFFTDTGIEDITSPNHDLQNDLLFTPIYKEQIGTYDKENTHVGNIMKHYKNTADAIVSNLISIFNGVNVFEDKTPGSTNNNNVVQVKEVTDILNSMQENLIKLIPMFISMESTLITNIVRLRNIISNKLYITGLVLFAISAFISILIIILTSYYNCKASGHLKPIKYTIHVLWNILLGIVAVFLAAVCIIGCSLILTRNLVPTVNYLLSLDYFNNSTNVFLSKSNDLPSFSHFNICMNNPNSSFAEEFGLFGSSYQHVESVYQNYQQVKLHYNSIEQYKTNVDLFTNINEILKTYIDDVSLTTNSTYHKQHDVEYVLDIMNRITDSSHQNTIQSSCFTRGTHDHWVTNISKCPIGYKYVSSGEVGSKCCLKLSEWTEVTIRSRYTNAICPSLEGLPLIEQFIQYFETLKKYESNTTTTLTNIINKNTALQSQYIGILDSLDEHYQNNHAFLDNFTKALRKYAGDNTTDSSTYDIFNCSILRNDMLAFYDNIYNKFYSFSLLNVFSFACFGLFSYINVYIIIRSIYHASNNELEVEHFNGSSSSSGSSSSISSVKSIENIQGVIEGTETRSDYEKPINKEPIANIRRPNTQVYKTTTLGQNEPAAQSVEENLREHIRRTYRLPIQDEDNDNITEEQRSSVGNNNNESEAQNNLNKRIRREYMRKKP